MLGSEASGVAGLQPGCVSFPRGTLKRQKGPQGMGTGGQAFRVMLEQPGEKRGEVDVEAGILPQRPVPS